MQTITSLSAGEMAALRLGRATYAVISAMCDAARAKRQGDAIALAYHVSLARHENRKAIAERRQLRQMKANQVDA